jgi:hypothetical protein
MGLGVSLEGFREENRDAPPAALENACESSASGDSGDRGVKGRSRA